MSKGKKFTHIYGIFTVLVCIFCFDTFKRAFDKRISREDNEVSLFHVGIHLFQLPKAKLACEFL